MRSSRYIPKYLYSWTIGYPNIISSSSFFFAFLLLKNMMPDFFLFIYILFSWVQCSIMLIASNSRYLPLFITARSSAYANTWCFFSSSLVSRSLNIIKNKVGDRTPPCTTPCPSFTSWYLVLILVCLYSHSIVLIRLSSMFKFLIFSNSSW